MDWIVEGPAQLVRPDGTRYIHRRKVTRIDDWRDTILGPVNFGYVRLGPVEIVRTPPPPKA